MEHERRHSPAIVAALILLAAQCVRAEIVSTAMLSFPAKTESVEYDNLFELRRLRNYAVLRQRFAGKALEDAKAALAKLDIHENDVHEIVMGTSATAFFGIVDGTFSGTVASKAATKSGIWPHVVGTDKAYCPKGMSTCVVFLENSVAAFGTLDQLKTISDARLGTIPRLSSNKTVSFLMSATQQRSPVRGAVYGSQLNTVIADALHTESGMNIDWSTFAANISAFGYSVNMDSKAHVVAKVQCKTATTAAVLRQMLGALSGVETIATKVGKDASSMPFQNMQVAVAGSLLDLSMDTPLPTL
jgi:hypothetical protein